MRICLTFVAAMLATAVLADDQQALTLESASPVVVKTVPASGADNVDPNLSEIRATFSKKMRDGSWSWVQMSQESFPKMRGKPKFLKDGRTNVFGVTLKPNHTYAIWLNSQKFQSFMDAEGRPAVPYLLVFKTRSAKKAEPVLKAQVRRKGSKIRFLTEAEQTIVDITSEFGIDEAKITRQSEQWPQSVVVRLHLQGLESFKAHSRSGAFEWSVASSGKQPSGPVVMQTLSYTASGTEQPDEKSDSFRGLRIVSEKNQIPLTSGYFEVPLPRKLFQGNPEEITLRWIDFYRN